MSDKPNWMAGETGDARREVQLALMEAGLRETKHDLTSIQQSLATMGAKLDSIKEGQEAIKLAAVQMEARVEARIREVDSKNETRLMALDSKFVSKDGIHKLMVQAGILFGLVSAGINIAVRLLP